MTQQGGAEWPAGLSPAARAVWAKHDLRTGGWLPLWRHMADSAAVAGLLWDAWLPRRVRGLIGAALPAGEADGRRLVVWLAGTHDIGKATPAFACQVEELAGGMRDAGLEMPLRREFGDERTLAPHGLAGQLLVQEWLMTRQGWPKRATSQFAVVAGGHHGVPPTYDAIQEVRIRPHLLGHSGAAAGAWRGVQTELLDAAMDAFGVRGRFGAWQSVKLPQTAQVLLTSLVIVADWIASNPELFPYFPDETRSDTERIAGAWRQLELPPPWFAVDPPADPAELFGRRFRLPEGAAVRPVQEAAVRAAQAMTVPGMLIIEAPMGEGKTEAALAAAEVFAARSGAGGVFVALPTMATGNAMFPRLLDWLGRLPDHRTGESGTHSVYLAHSKAALNRKYTELMGKGRGVADVGRDGPPRRRGENPPELAAHHWLRGRKKGMLSSFVVGTVDQLLFAGLKSRHLALRHLALAGKVVIIDEAHAYDTYMNSYLDRVLHWLGCYGVPVVVLSATLPAGRRRELAAAYAGADSGDVQFAPVQEARGYPLLTAVEAGKDPRLIEPAASGRGIEVLLEPLEDDVRTLADRLAGELSGGGCALVVRNTVDRVHEAAAALRERFGDEQVTVAHARFLDLDRAENDERLLARFGPPEKVAEARSARPTLPRHIVVASQVAEQSLDIDFDLLVTNLCPVDLLLQRMGRLHRHDRGGARQTERPPRLRRARCLVTGVDWAPSAGGAPEPVRGSRTVYGAHALLRSLAALRSCLAGTDGTGTTGRPVRLPADISPLVQTAYGAEPSGPPQWQQAMRAAEEEHATRQARQRQKAATFQLGPPARDGRALIDWLDAGVGDAEETPAGRAQVRDSRETLEVLVVQRRSDGSLTTVPWLGGGRGARVLPEDAVPEPWLGRAVAASGLRLPYHFSFPEQSDRALAELEDQCITKWQDKESMWLAGELILILDEDCRATLAGHELRYSRTDGLEVRRGS